MRAKKLTGGGDDGSDGVGADGRGGAGGSCDCDDNDEDNDIDDRPLLSAMSRNVRREPGKAV